MANKCDLLPPDSEALETFRTHVEARGYRFFAMSAATTQGTRELVKAAAGLLDQLAPCGRVRSRLCPAHAGGRPG